MAVAEETVSNQDKHVEQTQAFVRTGIQPDINLATVQTALANAKVQLVTARNNYAVAEAQLSQAMGVSVSEHYALSDAGGPAHRRRGRRRPRRWSRTREKNRPEIANLVNQRRAQEATVRSLQGRLRPEPERASPTSPTSASPSIRWRPTGTSAWG